MHGSHFRRNAGLEVECRMATRQVTRHHFGDCRRSDSVFSPKSLATDLMRGASGASLRAAFSALSAAMRLPSSLLDRVRLSQALASFRFSASAFALPGSKLRSVDR